MVRIIAEKGLETSVDLEGSSAEALEMWGSDLVGSGAISMMGTVEQIDEKLTEMLTDDLESLKRKCGHQCTLRTVVSGAYRNEDPTEIQLACEPVEIDADVISTVEEARDAEEMALEVCSVIHVAAAERVRFVIEQRENRRLRRILETRNQG